MDVLRGTVVAVACGSGHRFSKPRRELIKLVAGHGIEGDAHAGERMSGTASSLVASGYDTYGNWVCPHY
jgi:hypothetical protein